MTKKCSKCGRRYKTAQKKEELSRKLCLLMGWDDPWTVQNQAMPQGYLEELIKEIKRWR